MTTSHQIGAACIYQIEAQQAPRDGNGNPRGYISPSASPVEPARWYAYRAGPFGWAYAGIHATQEAAEIAAGVTA